MFNHGIRGRWCCKPARGGRYGQRRELEYGEYGGRLAVQVARAAGVCGAGSEIRGQGGAAEVRDGV